MRFHRRRRMLTPPHLPSNPTPPPPQPPSLLTEVTGAPTTCARGIDVRRNMTRASYDTLELTLCGEAHT